MALLAAPATQLWAQPGKLQGWVQLVPRWEQYFYIEYADMDVYVELHLGDGIGDG